jgi:asparagine synthase (glutamine-hydrolysing)
VPIGPSEIGTLSVPLRDPVRDLEDYVAAKHEDVRPLPYYRPGRSLGAVLRDNLAWTDHGVESHGVEYASLADLVMYGDYYPLGADTEGIFSRSLMQLRPYRTPYLDKRLIDLHQRIPRRYFIRRNLVNATVANTAPDLARIPHARSGVPLDRSFPVEFVGRNLHGLHRKYVGEAPTPKPHFDHKPWPDRRELLRATPFALDAIRENEARIRSLPFLDYEGAEETYWRHLDGEDNHTVLYSLLTFLEMPLTGRLADRAAESPSPEDGDASRADPSTGPRRRGIVDPPAPATESDRS